MRTFRNSNCRVLTAVVDYLVVSFRVCTLCDRRVYRPLKESYHLHLYGGSLSHLHADMVGNQESVGYMDNLARFPPYHISDSLLLCSHFSIHAKTFVTEYDGITFPQNFGRHN